MASAISLVSDLSPIKDDWKIRVRVIRLWRQNGFYNPDQTNSIDMILMDEMGQKIHATIKRNLVSKFENLIQEGNAYLLTNFGVAENSCQFPMAKHEYKINVYRYTKVKICALFSGSMYGFEFATFHDILARNSDTKHPVDVIGYLFSRGEIDDYSKNGRSTKRISFELADLEGAKIKCTLWGTFAQQFYDSVSKLDRSLHTIIIIQLGKIGNWQDKPVISNGLFGSRLFVDTDIEEISVFRQRIMSNVDPAASTHRVLELSDTSNFNDFVKTEKKYVDEVREIQKAVKYVVIGTIVCVLKDEDWYYLACLKCNKGVDDASDGAENEIWFCKKCNKKGVDVYRRFKVKIRVQDGTGSISFVLFDHEVSQIINKTANELFDKLSEDGEIDVFPTELNELVGKRFAFKIDVAPYNFDFNYRVYTVVKLTEDHHILSKLMNTVDGHSHGQASESEMSVDGELSSQGITTSCVTGGNDDVAGHDKITTPTSNGKRAMDVIDLDFVSHKSSPKKKLVMPTKP